MNELNGKSKLRNPNRLEAEKYLQSRVLLKQNANNVAKYLLWSVSSKAKAIMSSLALAMIIAVTFIHKSGR